MSHSVVAALVAAVSSSTLRMRERVAAVYALGIVADISSVAALDGLCRADDLAVRIQLADGEARAIAVGQGARSPEELDLASFDAVAYAAFDERMALLADGGGIDR